MQHSTRGFTLTELILVIVVISIIAVYAAPKFNLDDYDVTEAAGEVVEALRYTQVLAMEHSGLTDSDVDGNDDFYCFRRSGNNYTVSISDSNSNPAVTVANPMSGAASYTQSWGGAIGLASTVNDICFNSHGEPVTTAGVALAGDVTLTISSGTSSRTITVEELTGYTHR